MNRSIKSLLIVSTNLYDVSLGNCRQFVKLTKLVPAKLSCYTVLYSAPAKIIDKIKSASLRKI